MKRRMCLALGTRKTKQDDLFIPTAQLATGPGHPFYTKLNEVLAQAGFDGFVKELGGQFGIQRLCVDNFWGTEAMPHLAIAAYNLCVLLQRRLGQLEKCELNTRRWRLFGRAAVWSRARGKPALKLAVRGPAPRTWWREILNKLTAFPNCHAVASRQA